MSSVTIPVTTYSIRQKKPNHPFGSPGQLPVTAIANAAGRVLIRVSLDKVPTDATISSAKFQIYAQRATGGARALDLYPNTAAWTSSVTWAKRPAVGVKIATVTANGGVNTLWEWDITNWANTRSRNGLTIVTTVANATIWLKGSAFADFRPVVVVEYTVVPDTPSNLTPNGGAVSVTKPILTYKGEDAMTAQRIEYSNDGINTSYDTGFLAATSGLLDPAVVAGTPAIVAGQTIYWRATTNGPNGQSTPSPWASYSYQPLPVITILNPPDVTDDGTPTLQWSVAPAGSQRAWQATFNGDNGAADHSNWQSDDDTDWTSTKGVKVPGGVGTYILDIQDNIVRVAAANAPAHASAVKVFSTVLTNTGAAVDSLEGVFDDPIVTLQGVRAAGIPDYIGLFRDGVQVPIWDPVDSTPFMWAPAVNFFTGTAFTIADYTCDLRHEHTWQIRVKVGAATDSGGPVVTERFHTDGIWLVDTRNGDRVEFLGLGQAPVIEQHTDEGSIVHTPVHGDLVVEQVRRRLMRTTRYGSISGLLTCDDEDTMDAWVAGDSGQKFRLIFGKSNWPVIIGDYDPSDQFYPGDFGADRVLCALNWWQRQRDY
jgi:hypothetical protein